MFNYNCIVAFIIFLIKLADVGNEHISTKRSLVVCLINTKWVTSSPKYKKNNHVVINKKKGTAAPLLRITNSMHQD